MNSISLEKLEKKDSNPNTGPVANDNSVQIRRKKILEICDSLQESTEQYEPEKTLPIIEDYVKKYGRIIYSEITDQIYGMSEQDQGIFNTNLEKLISYILQYVEDEKIKDAVTRLWDHVHLALRQDENVRTSINQTVDIAKKEVKETLYEELKKVEREYITILGIFASIVLSFVGGMTFSTSVLKNMNNVSIYRLTFVIILLGFILINIVNLLVHYIFQLNKTEKDKSTPPIIKGINFAIFLALVLLIVAWLLRVHEFPQVMDWADRFRDCIR